MQSGHELSVLFQVAEDRQKLVLASIWRMGPLGHVWQWPQAWPSCQQERGFMCMFLGPGTSALGVTLMCPMTSA